MTATIASTGANAPFQWQERTAARTPLPSAEPESAAAAQAPGRAATGTLLANARSAPSAAEVFSAMDSNGDGQVDTGELTSYAALPPAAPPHAAGGAVPEMAEPDENLAALIEQLAV